MKIDRSNYESFFIDYLDGNLSEGQIDDILFFLQNNPDLKEELESISEFKLDLTDHIFPDKSVLLKTETDEISEFDSLAIAYFENDLSDTDKQSLLKEIEGDTEKIKIFQSIERLRLIPETGIIFPNKKQLLQEKKKPVFFTWITRVAAILLLGLAIWTLFPEEQDQNQTDFPVITENDGKTTLPEPEITIHTPENEPDKNTEPELTEPVFIPEKIIANLELNEEPTEITEPNVREPIPELLKVKKAVVIPIERMPLALAYPSTREPEKNYTMLDEYLAQKILNAPEGESFTLKNMTKAGLHAAEKISNNKLEVATNVEGKITGVNFNSWLLAFSIPTKNK